MDTTTREIVKTYKKMLAPMGFTVTPTTRSTEPTNRWMPKNKKELEELDLSGVDSQLETVTEKLNQYEKQFISIKEKAVKFMMNSSPNELTRSLYEGVYSKDNINQKAIKLKSNYLDELNQLKSYLVALRLEKLQEDMCKKLSVQVDNITDLKVERDVNGVSVNIFVDLEQKPKVEPVTKPFGGNQNTTKNFHNK